MIGNDRQIKIYIVGAKAKANRAPDEIKVKGWNLVDGERSPEDIREIADSIAEIIMEWMS